MEVLQRMDAALSDRTHRGLVFAEAMFGPLDIEPGSVVLNLGAGDSPLSDKLRDRGARVVDLDYGYRKRPHAHHHPGEESQYAGLPVVARADKLPLADDSVDTAIASFLYMHMDEESIAASLVDLMRVTAPEGQIKIGLLRPAQFNPLEGSSLADIVEVREATHVDGHDRPLHSLTIHVPKDKESIADEWPQLTAQLAKSEIFGNKSRRRKLGRLAFQGLGNLGPGGNRRYDPRAHEVHAIPRSEKQPEPTSDEPDWQPDDEIVYS